MALPTSSQVPYELLALVFLSFCINKMLSYLILGDPKNRREAMPQRHMFENLSYPFD